MRKSPVCAQQDSNNNVNQFTFIINSTLNPRNASASTKETPALCWHEFFLDLDRPLCPRGEPWERSCTIPVPWPYATEKSAIIYSPSKKRGVVRTWPNNALPGLRYHHLTICQYTILICKAIHWNAILSCSAIRVFTK